MQNLDRFLAIAQKLKLEGLLGGADQSKEERYYESSYNVKEEDTIHEFDVSTTSPPSETKTLQKTKQKQSIKAKTDGIIALKVNGEELSDIDAKLCEYIEKLPDRILKCKICGHIAKQMCDIKNHIETHMEGLSFPCQVCGKTLCHK